MAAALAAVGGFSTVETSAIMVGMSLLSATAAPHIQEYVESARATKAAGDVRVIAVSIARLTWDVGPIGRHQHPPPAVLVSDGETPAVTTPATRSWSVAADNETVQSLGAHLVDNVAGYHVASGETSGWKGPYLNGLSADPWGSRYAVNVGRSDRRTGQAVFVLSAGPNRLVETPFDMVGMHRGGDDVVGLIGRR